MSDALLLSVVILVIAGVLFAAYYGFKSDGGDLNQMLFRAHRAFFIFYAIITVLFVFVLAVQVTRSTFDFASLLFVVVFSPLAACHYYAAKGARNGTTWGRTLSRVIGAIMLIGVPVGTLIGIYILMQTGKKWRAADTGGDDEAKGL